MKKNHLHLILVTAFLSSCTSAAIPNEPPSDNNSETPEYTFVEDENFKFNPKDVLGESKEELETALHYAEERNSILNDELLVTPFSKSADEVFLTDEYSNYSGNPITLKEFLDPFKEVGGGHIYENDIFTVNDGYYCTLSSSLNEDKTLCPRVYKTDKHYEFSFSYSKEYLQMIDYLGAYLGIILDGNVASYSLTSQSYHYFFERCGFFYALSLTENLNYDVYYNDLTIYLINKDPNFNKKCLKNMSEYNGKCGSIHRFDIEKTREYIDKNNLYF